MNFLDYLQTSDIAKNAVMNFHVHMLFLKFT